MRGAILVFWTCFWLFNVVDKAIGGSTFLWVGRDRFAQFQKYFASAGLESPLIADLALYVAAALEVFALVFFAGALRNFAARRMNEARSWCFIGIVVTLVTFTFFSIGDHLFGDRFELLEHTLFLVRYACLVGGVPSIGREGQPVSSGTYPAIWTLQMG